MEQTADFVMLQLVSLFDHGTEQLYHTFQSD